MRWFGFKKNDSAILLPHDVKHPGVIDLHCRVDIHAAGKEIDLNSKTASNTLRELSMRRLYRRLTILLKSTCDPERTFATVLKAHRCSDKTALT